MCLFIQKSSLFLPHGSVHAIYGVEIAMLHGTIWWRENLKCLYARSWPGHWGWRQRTGCYQVMRYPAGSCCQDQIGWPMWKKKKKRFVSEKIAFTVFLRFSMKAKTSGFFFWSERDNKWTRKAEKAEFCFFLFIFFSRTKMNKND